MVTKYPLYDSYKDGFISHEHFKDLIMRINLFNPKEVNIILRHMNSETFDCKKFESELYDVRFELAKSRLTDTNIDKITDHLIA